MKIYNKNEENKEEDTWQIFTAQGFTREILAVFWFRKRNIGHKCNHYPSFVLCCTEILAVSSLSVANMSLLALELKLAREDLGHIIKKETKSVTRLLLENHYLDVYKKRSEPSPRRKKKRPRWLIHRIYLYWPSLKFVKDKLPCISSLSRNHKKTERKDTAIIFFSPFSCDLPWNKSHPSLSFFF